MSKESGDIMQMCYETERLQLRLLQDNAAPQVLDFYSRNREAFEKWEPDRPGNFYTASHQAALLRVEFQMAARKTALRFWVFCKEAPNQIIGTVSFQEISRSIYQSCRIGYKFDPSFWHQGYASEALFGAIGIVFQEMGLHRVEALVLPENTASIRLLERLGFRNEGISYGCVYLHGQWCDHLRFSLVRP